MLMTTQELSPPRSPSIHIDHKFLLRKVAALVQVKRCRRTWNEMGETVLRDYISSAPTPRVEAQVSLEAAHWRMAKSLVYAVLASHEPQHDAIRQRLGNLQEPSTPQLLSTLSLWLAGKMGISVSVTVPLVAVMLYAAAEASGNWDVLVELSKP